MTSLSDKPSKTQPAESAQTPQKRKGRLSLLHGVLLLALVLRVLFMAEYAQSPFHKNLTLDERVDDHWAWAMATGGKSFFDGEPYYREPGYPYLMAATYRLFGRDPGPVRALQLALSVASVWLLYVIGASLFGETAGLASAFLLGAYDLQILYTDCLTKETVSLFLSLLSLWTCLMAFRRPSIKTWLFAGITCGILSVVRSAGPLFAAMFIPAFFIKICCRKDCLVQGWEPEGDEPRVSLPRAMILSAIFLAAMCACVMPVTLRNYRYGGEFVPVAYQTGHMFYLGNGPFADGKLARIPGVSPNPVHEHKDMARLAEQLSGKKLNCRETSSFWFGKTFEHIRSEPAAFIGLMIRKTLYFWNRFEIPDPIDLETARRFSFILRLPLAGFWIIGPLALVGLIVIRGCGMEEWIVRLLAMAAIAAVIAFFVNARYRFMAAPFLLLWAGAGATATAQAFRATDRRKILVCAGVLACGLALAFSPILKGDPAIGFLMLGDYHREAGRLDEALTEYRKARNAAPASPEGYMAESGVLFTLGRTDEACVAAASGLKACPWSSELQALVGRLLSARGEYGEAVIYLKKALELEPANELVWIDLALACEKAKQPDAADEVFAKSLANRPDSALLHAEYARFLADRGRHDQARGMAQKALGLEPGNKLALEVLDAIGEDEAGGKSGSSSP
ncbi:MAG TPA: tetratricopeptide repeat protein [Candidatus Brocadiia bacterium]|nr:tetratricopeptide repeat protein [Candidatus Brocadiia bacterium]